MRIKSLLLGTVAATALAAPALAADLSYPVKAAPVAYVPAFTWTVEQLPAVLLQRL